MRGVPGTIGHYETELALNSQRTIPVYQIWAGQTIEVGGDRILVTATEFDDAAYRYVYGELREVGESASSGEWGRSFPFADQVRLIEDPIWED